MKNSMIENSLTGAGQGKTQEKSSAKLSVMALALLAVAGGPAYALTGLPTTSTGNNFSMLDSAGGGYGGTNDVTFKWDGTYARSTAQAATGVRNAAVSSPTAFSTYTWVAHHMTVYAPGTYTIYTGCPSTSSADATYNPGCGTGTPFTLTVPAGYVGAHMLFNWNVDTNIDVVNLWRMNASWASTGAGPNTFLTTGINPNSNDLNTVWSGVSIDTDAGYGLDGYNGVAMKDGPFLGFNANFNVMGITPYVAPTPASITMTPANAATGVVPNTAVTVVFDKPVLVSSVTGSTFTLVKTSDSSVVTCPPVASVATGVLTATTFTCTPSATLAFTTQYTGTLTTGILDAASVALTAPRTWSFTTSAAPDNTAPNLLTKTPADAATGVLIGATIGLGFDEAMNFASVQTALTVKDSNLVAVAGVLSSADNVNFTFTPSTSLASGMVYTVTLAATATDGAANAVSGGQQQWTFTTSATNTTVQSVLASSGPAGGGCVAEPHGKADWGLVVALFASLGYLLGRRRFHS